MKHIIEKLQKRHSDTLEFYTTEKLSEREQNLLRGEMSFLIELMGYMGSSEKVSTNKTLSEGCIVEVIGNSNDHGYSVGDKITLSNWDELDQTWRGDGADGDHWYFKEKDVEIC